LRDGYGSMKYTSGNSYEGEWKLDRKCGQGVMVWRDVDEVYTGQWRDDCPDGLGEYIWGDSAAHTVRKECCNIYRGHFREGKRCGAGTFFYMNGSQYTGEWVEDAKHGEGVYLYADGRIFSGEFEHNRMITKYSPEEASAPRATDAVNPQFKLHLADVFAAFPLLLSSAESMGSDATGGAVAALAVSISTLAVSSTPATATASRLEQERSHEMKEMERLLLKYNHYIRSALRYYTDLANKRRLRDTLSQHHMLSQWAPVDRTSRVFKVCATARIFQKRMFCMNLDQMLRFVREIGLIGPYFRSYDLSQCLLQLRAEVDAVSARKLRDYRGTKKRMVRQEQQQQQHLQETAASAAPTQRGGVESRTAGKLRGATKGGGTAGTGAGAGRGKTSGGGGAAKPQTGLRSSLDAVPAPVPVAEQQSGPSDSTLAPGSHKEEKEEGEEESDQERRQYTELHITSLLDAYLSPAAVLQPSCFQSQSGQPLMEREVVELLVRAIAVRYARAKGSAGQEKADAEDDTRVVEAKLATMSLTQLLYYTLAQKVSL
jgi:hypothetical protein